MEGIHYDFVWFNRLRINEIGKTVKAWKTVYKNWDETKDSIIKELLPQFN